jgi:hypothetical protein
MNMKKRIKHRAMLLTKDEHAQWHKKHGSSPRISRREHANFLRRMGISPSEDEAWHQQRRTASDRPSRQSLNPFAIGGGFLAYCVKQGWLTTEKEGKRTLYFGTKKGRERLRGFGINI